MFYTAQKEALVNSQISVEIEKNPNAKAARAEKAKANRFLYFS